MTFLVCLPRAPALRQELVAMLAEGALESPSVLVLAFHSSLFLVEGSSDGSAPGDRFLSPGRMCSFTSFRLRSVASALSLPGSGLFFLLWICWFTVGSSGAFPRGNFWGSREGWVVVVLGKFGHQTPVLITRLFILRAGTKVKFYKSSTRARLCNFMINK